MNRIVLIGLASALSFASLVGCSVESGADNEGSTSSEVGLANPAAVHCKDLGYTLSNEQCVFHDGTSCEQWAFFRGECSAPAPAPSCTPLPAPGGGAVGLANPAAEYCTALGYTSSEETCLFPDGSSCEPWSFYRGECGQSFSFCNKNGGTVSNEQEDMGGWTASYAVCTLASGASCEEREFAQSCECN